MRLIAKNHRDVATSLSPRWILASMITPTWTTCFLLIIGAYGAYFVQGPRDTTLTAVAFGVLGLPLLLGVIVAVWLFVRELLAPLALRALFTRPEVVDAIARGLAHATHHTLPNDIDEFNTHDLRDMEAIITRAGADHAAVVQMWLNRPWELFIQPNVHLWSFDDDRDLRGTYGATDDTNAPAPASFLTRVLFTLAKNATLHSPVHAVFALHAAPTASAHGRLRFLADMQAHATNLGRAITTSPTSLQAA